MKKSRYTESQIMGVLKEVDAGMRLRKSAVNMVSAVQPTIIGSLNTAAWKRLTSND